jgi:hypothetical protein
VTELASDKAYFASLDIPPLLDARKQGYSFDDANRHGTITPVCTFQATIWRSLLRCCLRNPVLPQDDAPTRRFAATLRPRWRLAILIVPLGLFIFDILQNISVLAMLKSYPSLDPGLASAASLFSQIKWLSAFCG